MAGNPKNTKLWQRGDPGRPKAGMRGTPPKPVEGDYGAKEKTPSVSVEYRRDFLQRKLKDKSTNPYATKKKRGY